MKKENRPVSPLPYFGRFETGRKLLFHVYAWRVRRIFRLLKYARAAPSEHPSKSPTFRPFKPFAMRRSRTDCSSSSNHWLKGRKDWMPWCSTNEQIASVTAALASSEFETDTSRPSASYSSASRWYNNASSRIYFARANSSPREIVGSMIPPQLRCTSFGLSVNGCFVFDAQLYREKLNMSILSGQKDTSWSKTCVFYGFSVYFLLSEIVDKITIV